MPSVTVLMAVFNGGAYLAGAIESILAQTWSDFELLIVDDGSTDGSPGVARGYGDPRVRVASTRGHVGQIAALNHGLALARGTLIARQDADDLSHPDRLARQVDLLRRRPDVALVGTQGRVIDARGARLGVVDRPEDVASVRWYALFENPFIHTSVVARRSVAVDELGGFDEAFGYTADFELWSRVLARHPALNLGERLIDYRRHDASLTGPVHAGVGRALAGPGHRALLATLLARNASTLLGEGLTDVEADLLAGFALGVDHARLPAFIALVARLLRRYRALDPAGTASADFLRTLAGQYDAIAHRVVPSRRRAAARVYAAALAAEPRLATRLPWARMLGRIVVGEDGLRRVREGWSRAAAIGRLRHPDRSKT
jgi:glycosyltransferase involved in cell wall biosynthesis